MSRSFSSPDFNRSFPAEGPGHGAPWSSCTSPSPPATEIQEENLAAIPCPGLVGAQGTHRSMLEKEPPRRFHGTHCASRPVSPCGHWALPG